MTITEVVHTLLAERLSITRRLSEIDEQLLDAHKIVGLEVVESTEGRFNESRPAVKVVSRGQITKEQILAVMTKPMKTSEIASMFLRDGVAVRHQLYELLQEGRVTVSGRTNGRLWKKEETVRAPLPAPVDDAMDDEPFINTLPQEVRSSVKPVDVRCFGPANDPRRQPCPDGAIVDGNITSRCPRCAKAYHGPRKTQTIEVVFDGTAKAPLQSLLGGDQYGNSSLRRAENM